MGKTGGFLKYGRKDPGYRPSEERTRDHRAVELRLDGDEIEKQAARCMECGTPFCHGCGCPLSNNIPELNDLVYQGRWEEASDLLLATNNFPEFTARLCPALCEASCVLGINDDPIAIRQIEMEIIETAFAQGYIRPSPPASRSDQRVAVIGSGPAGLAVADTLNNAGYQVVVYCDGKEPGGILRYGIPDFKLEKWVVDRRTDLMRQEGVVFEAGVVGGEDVSYRYLHDRFDAVCLCSGARQPRDLKVPGRDLQGIHFAMDFLVCQNLKNAGEPVSPEKDINARGKTVVVIGGGDTGSDCLGTAIRQGARKVYQFEIMPKPPESRPESTPWPMWPNVLRESSSHKEGGERHWSVSTKELLGRDGHLVGMRYVELEWEQDEEGRMSMKEKDGSEAEIEVDMVFLAMGFVGPSRNKILDDLNIEHDERGNINIAEDHMTNVAGVFAAGDMARGQSLIVRAIADGREAAEGIIAYLHSRD